MKSDSIIYRGWHDGTVSVEGAPLPPRHDLQNHSPTGFSWGYGGSGPSQLALAILAHFLEDDKEALAWYQPFKWRIIATLPQPQWKLYGSQVRDALEVLKAEGRRGS